MDIKQYEKNGMKWFRLENDFLEVEVVPEAGGKITGIKDKKTGHQFLWKNRNLTLQKHPAGSEYDPNFYGGIDELLPNDMPEQVNDVESPDHGELWTMPLDFAVEGDRLELSGTLPLCGLRYTRKMRLHREKPGIELQYKIVNPTPKPKEFLWKFHAALSIEPGDEILSPSRTGKVADPEYTRWTDFGPFPWPVIESQRADRIPPKENSVDFFYLYDLTEGYMAWRRPEKKLAFLYCFDKDIFPYNWYFASYGGFLDHYTAVLEPCTAMPLSVKEAAKQRQCSVLLPGEELSTTVSIYAGPDEILNEYTKMGR